MAEACPVSQLRLLILSPKPSTAADASTFPPVLHALTGESPSADLSTFAGYTSHSPLVLRTKYYSRKVSLWCDELPSANSKAQITDGKTAAEDKKALGASAEDIDEVLDLQQWQETMLSSAASEVRAVMGGVVLILPVSTSQSSVEAQLDPLMPYVRAVHALREAIEDDSLGRDVASVIILQDSRSAASAERDAKTSATMQALAEALESETIENDMFGWDVACCNSQAPGLGPGTGDSQERNAFGEKLGMARVIEVLEGIDWAAPAGAEGDEEREHDSSILGDDHFKDLDHELQQEMLGLKLSMLDEGGAEDVPSEGVDMTVEQMDDLKSRVLAIRDTVAGMPQDQKEAFAKREIDRIMRDL